MLGLHTPCARSIADLLSVGPAVIYFSTRALHINSESTTGVAHASGEKTGSADGGAGGFLG
jgi:hypothetical protein